MRRRRSKSEWAHKTQPAAMIAGLMILSALGCTGSGVQQATATVIPGSVLASAAPERPNPIPHSQTRPLTSQHERTSSSPTPVGVLPGPGIVLAPEGIPLPSSELGSSLPQASDPTETPMPTMAPSIGPVQSQALVPIDGLTHTEAATADPNSAKVPTASPPPARDVVTAMPFTPILTSKQPVVTLGNEVGDLAFLFTLPSASGIEVSLVSYRGDKDVVLVFYRAFW